MDPAQASTTTEALRDLVAYIDQRRERDRAWVVRFTPATPELARARDALEDSQ
jgi:hypothetical protein